MRTTLVDADHKETRVHRVADSLLKNSRDYLRGHAIGNELGKLLKSQSCLYRNVLFDALLLKPEQFLPDQFSNLTNSRHSLCVAFNASKGGFAGPKSCAEKQDLRRDSIYLRIGLVEHRYIRVRHLPPSGGRPPDPVYEVNPHCKIAGRTG